MGMAMGMGLTVVELTGVSGSRGACRPSKVRQMR